MIRWMVGLVLGGLGAGVGLTTFLVRALQPPPPRPRLPRRGRPRR